MPEPPVTNPLTHYVFENPWPAGIVLLAVALILGWMGLREGLKGRVRLAMVLGTMGVAIILAGRLVTTASEHAEHVVERLVQAVVSEDVVQAAALFSDEALMTAGSPQNPGFGIDFIRERLDTLATRYDIDSNSITRLQGASDRRDEADVRLACMTTVASFPYPNSSQWIVRVRRMPDGQWKIVRLTCVAINDQTPPIDRAW